MDYKYNITTSSPNQNVVQQSALQQNDVQQRVVKKIRQKREYFKYSIMFIICQHFIALYIVA